MKSNYREPDSMMDEFDYGTGHFCRDNGTGDYALHCPKLGVVKSIPFMMGGMLGGYLCHCGAELIGAPLTDSLRATISRLARESGYGVQ